MHYGICITGLLNLTCLDLLQWNICRKQYSEMQQCNSPQSKCSEVWPNFYTGLLLQPSTRRFSNHVSRLLSRSHTFAIIEIIRFENTSKYVDTLTLFSKNLNQRSLTPRWPLTPCLLRSHMWLYPRIIVSKSHDNTSMYVDTVINFAKYHIHTHTYYILHTTYRMSDHIVSYWTQFRRDKNGTYRYNNFHETAVQPHLPFAFSDDLQSRQSKIVSTFLWMEFRNLWTIIPHR